MSTLHPVSSQREAKIFITNLWQPHFASSKSDDRLARLWEELRADSVRLQNSAGRLMRQSL